MLKCVNVEETRKSARAETPTVIFKKGHKLIPYRKWQKEAKFKP